MSLVNRLLNRERGSSHVAKGRLQQVLAQDRARVSPGKLRRMRQDVIRTVSQYLDIDPENVEIELSRVGRDVRLDAHIPLRRGA